jgi:hypothetical protein
VTQVGRDPVADRPLPDRVAGERAGPARRTGVRAGWLRAALAVATRPSLWWVAVRQLMRIARTRWWRRAPFLPLPDPDYLRFRLETAYGEQVGPRPADVVSYLRWCRDGRRDRLRRRR